MTTKRNSNMIETDRQRRLVERLTRALEHHHLPRTPEVQRARSVLREALSAEPDGLSLAEQLTFRERAVDEFYAAIERSSR